LRTQLLSSLELESLVWVDWHSQQLSQLACSSSTPAFACAPVPQS
jgi:hypothetical protein